ncbi:MAG: hypothetical protein QM784_20810 [Polyangiaceae bacterium]
MTAHEHCGLRARRCTSSLDHFRAYARPCASASALGVLTLGVLTLAPVTAFAAGSTLSVPAARPVVTTNRQTGSAQSTETPAESSPYWSRGAPRLFLSGRLVPGLGFGRLALNAGYGQPHWLWAGPEIIGVVTPYYSAAQAGVHLSAIIVDGLFTWRRTYSFSHGTLPNDASVSSNDLKRWKSPHVDYDAIDASLWGFVPYRRFLFAWEATWVKPLGIARDDLIYEKSNAP